MDGQALLLAQAGSDDQGAGLAGGQGDLGAARDRREAKGVVVGPSGAGPAGMPGAPRGVAEQRLRLHPEEASHVAAVVGISGPQPEGVRAVVRIFAGTVQDCIKKVVDELGWAKRGVSTHTLRHCYATHLLEIGVNLRQIQKYMGHSTLMTTTIYLHLTTVGEEVAVAKINALMNDRQVRHNV